MKDIFQDQFPLLITFGKGNPGVTSKDSISVIKAVYPSDDFLAWAFGAFEESDQAGLDEPQKFCKGQWIESKDKNPANKILDALDGKFCS